MFCHITIVVKINNAAYAALCVMLSRAIKRNREPKVMAIVVVEVEGAVGEVRAVEAVEEVVKMQERVVGQRKLGSRQNKG